MQSEIWNLLVLIENEIKVRHKEINQRQRGCPGREEKFKLLSRDHRAEYLLTWCCDNRVP